MECKRVEKKETDDKYMSMVAHLNSVKIEFCDVIEELSFDERCSSIVEYLNAHKVSDRVEKFLISLVM